MKVLCINNGSSSLKFLLYEMPSKKEIANGLFERIGSKDSFYTLKCGNNKIEANYKTHTNLDAVNKMLSLLIDNKLINSLDDIKGVGHRVVHGGDKYFSSVIIDDEVIKNIKEFEKFAPVHNKSAIEGILAIKKALPNISNVAVFDTSFHQTMQKDNYLYPVPYEWYLKYGVRKYGFHGTSNRFVTEKMQEKLDKKDLNLIVCHIGSGISVTCIEKGYSIDTSMGLTPLDGAMMGTRSGSIDPSIISYICQETFETPKQVINILNKQSGIYGLLGVADCRDMENMALAGDKDAKLVFEMYCEKITSYIGTYFLELKGKVDAIVFTAGVGENSPWARQIILNNLIPLGVKIDDNKNDEIAGYKKYQEGIITTKDSSIKAFVIPTNEQVIIAEDTYNLIK